MSTNIVEYETRMIIGVALLLVTALSQLPYIIGQYFAREKILVGYEGYAEELFKEELKKFAPLYPTFEFFTALFANGTAGGIIIFVFDNFI